VWRGRTPCRARFSYLTRSLLPWVSRLDPLRCLVLCPRSRSWGLRRALRRHRLRKRAYRTVKRRSGRSPIQARRISVLTQEIRPVLGNIRAISYVPRRRLVASRLSSRLTWHAFHYARPSLGVLGARARSPAPSARVEAGAMIVCLMRRSLARAALSPIAVRRAACTVSQVSVKPREAMSYKGAPRIATARPTCTA
jgi:hypothetical protein